MAQILTETQLREVAPSIYTEKPIATASDRYTFIPTSKIISDLAQLGWYVVDAKQQRVNKKTKAKREGYQKHFIQLEHPDLIQKFKHSDIIPRLLGINSHDGLNSFKFQSGIFRLVCSNGLVVADTLYNTFKVRHKDYTLTEVEDRVFEYVNDLPDTISQIEDYRSIKIDQKQKEDFASKAIDLRWKEKAPVTVDNILQVQRTEDMHSDLWTVFNVIQENLINPNFSSPYSKRRVKKVVAIDRNLNLNKQLWTLMAGFAQQWK